MRRGILSADFALAVLVAGFLLFPRGPAAAAGFDCGKARAGIEQIICGDPTLSALDDELGRAYKEALRLVSDPAALRKSQAAWLKTGRSSAEGPKEIEAAYLARIEEIRLDPELKKRLFAVSKPPASILGRYSETEPLCFSPKEGAGEYDCQGDVESYIDLRPGQGNTVRVKGELWFFNGHVCGPFEGTGEWVNGLLRLPRLDEGARCVLLLRFQDGKVLTEDPASLCKEAFLCGANAGFHSIELPKLDGNLPQKKQ